MSLLSRLPRGSVTERATCSFCGKSIQEKESARKTVDYGDAIEAAFPFCSDSCANAYQMREHEYDEIEEFEEVFRAGAT